MLILILSTAVAFAGHPANIPSARVHVNTDNTVELHVRFDILAFCLETSPQELSDGPMNALLDGPQTELQNRLSDAQTRLLAGMSVILANGAATVQSVWFPTCDDVYACARVNGKQRLPVMLTVVLKEQLPVDAKTISCKFPEVMGSVVVTTEMPYQEPVSEPVDPGASSSTLQIPSVTQIRAAAAQMLPAATPTPDQTTSVPPKSEDIAPKPVAVNKEVVETIMPHRARAGGAVLGSAQSMNTASRIEEPKSKLTQTSKPVVEQRYSAPQSVVVDTEQLPLKTPGGRPAWYLLFARYIRMGFLHIIPQGLDHILFVLGLFLLSRRTKALLTQISAFTIAHSITLGLSLYGVISLPSNIVEPLIAASIVFVAVENLFTTEMKAWRPLVVFGFGLVHGLGFATALKEVGLAKGDFLTGLVGFNCGVELGQLSVVALAFVAVGWLRTKPAYRPAIVMPASFAIAAIALFWTIQRII